MLSNSNGERFNKYERFDECWSVPSGTIRSIKNYWMDKANSNRPAGVTVCLGVALLDACRYPHKKEEIADELLDLYRLMISKGQKPIHVGFEIAKTNLEKVDRSHRRYKDYERQNDKRQEINEALKYISDQVLDRFVVPKDRFGRKNKKMTGGFYMPGFHFEYNEELLAGDYQEVNGVHIEPSGFRKMLNVLNGILTEVDF